LPVLDQIPEHERHLVRQMLEGSVNTFMARGVGRYFDAAGAIGLARAVSSFEGQVALEWNLAADPDDTASYPWDTGATGALLSVDLRSTFRAIVGDVGRAVPAAAISARFHNTLADLTAAVVRRLLHRLGPMPVVLSGGCFQNARLTESIVANLGSAVQVVRHELVPPGDGGLSLGQAAVASATVDAGGAFTSEGLCA